jgi:hypothetical protein
VLVLEPYFALKSSAAVREALRETCPDKEAPNKTTGHRQVTIRNKGSVCDKCSSRDKTV